MAGFTDSVEVQLLDFYFGGEALTPPATTYLAVSSTTPTDAGGNVTEPSGSNYSRIAIAASLWAAATGTAPVTVSLTVAIAGPVPSADWLAAVDLTHWILYSASSAGTALTFGTMADPQPLLSGNTWTINPTVKLGDPADSY